MLGRWCAVGVIALMVGTAAAVDADVKTKERTQIKFEGVLGRMVNLFGGKAAKEGIVNSVALKGNRMLSLNDADGEIIDLDEEKLYEIDVKKKTYSVATFAELRQRMEEARKKAEKDVQEARRDDKPADAKKPEKEMEVDFTVKETGQTRQIAGFDTKETLATIAVREKGKKLEESGGLVMNVSMWMAPSVPGLKEIAEFRMRYAKALYGPQMVQAAQDMAQAIAMYPAMKDAMAKFQAEAGKMSGVAVMTTSTFEAVAGAEQQAQQEKQAESQKGDDSARGVGGLVGGLGRRMMRRKGDDEPKPAAGTPGHTTIMTSTTEFLEVSSSVSGGDVSVPTGFKLKSS